MTLLRPSHTFASVARELVEGLENGSIYVQEPEAADSAPRPNVHGQTITGPQVQAALRECVCALERVASSPLPPDLEQRLQTLGENAEFLAGPANEDLLALVTLAQQRTVEKLEADRALRTLRAALSEAPAAKE